MTYGDLITANGQLQWAGMVFGDGALTYLTDDGITGWEDHPGIDSGNVARTAEHGSEPGSKLLQERIVTWSGAWRPPRVGDDGSALRALRAATTIPDDETEDPLVIRLLGETLLAWGSIVGRALPSDQTYSVRAGKLLLQWSCSDPRRYSLTEHTVHLALPPPTTIGLAYSLVYPLDYGTAPPPSTGVATNVMEASTPPRLVFSGGAMSGIKVANTSTGETLAFDITMVSTDVLEVDTRAGTVLLNGVDRLTTRSNLSSPVRGFLFARGVNNLALTAQSWGSGAGVDVFWRDATF